MTAITDAEAEREIDLGRWKQAAVERWWLVAAGLVAGVAVGALLSLAGELRDAVGRTRPRHGLLGSGIALGCAVNRRGRREDDTHLVARGGLEHALRGEHVAAQVEREDVAEAAHAGLARQMEQAVQAREVQLVLGEVDAADLEPARVLLLQRAVVVVGEAVDPNDLMAGGEECFGQV